MRKICYIVSEFVIDTTILSSYTLNNLKKIKTIKEKNNGIHNPQGKLSL